MPTALFVNSFKIGVPKQSSTGRKVAAFAGALGTACWSDTAHHAPSKIRLRNSRHFRKDECYSRKPGLTETRLRPLARRREITA